VTKGRDSTMLWYGNTQLSPACALFAKFVKPDQTGQQVARLAGDIAECTDDDAIGRPAVFAPV
jgi:hypothetical protein